MTGKERHVFWVTYDDETTGSAPIVDRRHVQILAADGDEARYAAIHYYSKRFERVREVVDTGVTEAEFIAKGGQVAP